MAGSDLTAGAPTVGLGELAGEPAPAGPAGRARRRRRVRVTGSGIVTGIAIGWLALVIFLAIFAAVLPLPSPTKIVGASLQSPQWFSGPFLGTDRLGRSELSRLIYGARVSLTVGLVSTAIGMIIGGALGLLAARFKGIVRWVVDVLTYAVLAIPPLILLLSLGAVLTPSLTTIVISLSLLVIPQFARLTRANALGQLSRDYVTAARAMSISDTRILLRDVLPNCVAPILAYALIVVANLIVAESSLSFLGLGIPPPRPSWGGMISDGRDILTQYPFVVFLPALAIVITVYSLNTVGEALQRKLDV